MQVTRVLRATGAFLVAGLLFGSAAMAQSSSVIIGTVSDASNNQPVADVVVTATSPNLQGEQIVVTDAAGQYRIPQLPPGTYTLRFEKESYQPFSRSDIQLRLDRTLRVNVALAPSGIEQTIDVTARAPTIDVGSTSTGVNVGADFVRNIAVVRPTGKGGAARSFESLAEIAPGANADAYGVSINGTTSPENGFVIDGLSVNDPGFGILGTPLSVEFVQDVNVITGGYMPEYGRATGGILNAVTKSGSNEFHGSVFGNWTPGALEGEEKQITSPTASILGQTNLWNLGDFGAEVGGPIAKDKLWFYAGVAPSFTRYKVERSLNSLRLCTAEDVASGAFRCNVVRAGGNANANIGTRAHQDEAGATLGDVIPGTTTFRFADQRSVQYIGKLTYLINQDHNVSLSVYGSPTTSGSRTTFPFDNQDGLPAAAVGGKFESLSLINKNDSLDIALKLANSFMDKKLLLDTTVGWHHQDVSSLPVDGSGSDDARNPATLAGTPGVQFRRNNPVRHSLREFEDSEAVAAACGASGYTPGTGSATPGSAEYKCPVATYRVGGPGFITEDLLDRYQGKVVGTYLLSGAGHHVAKAGVDLEYVTYDRNKAYSGGVLLREDTRARYFDEIRNYAYLAGPNDIQYLGNIRAKSTSTNIGAFVQDSWSVFDLFTLNAGLRYDSQNLVGDNDTPGLALGNQWSPRVGVLYDFTQQGRSKFYANYARFYESVPLDLVDRQFPGERQVYALRASRYPRNLAPFVQPGGGTCDPLGDPSTATINGACFNQNNLLPLLGYPDPNSAVIPTGGERSPVDPELRPQSSDEFVVGGEYEVFSNGRLGLSYTKRYMNSVIEDMSRDEAATYFIGNPGEGIAKDFPKATRDYDAVTVFFDKTFADLWLAQLSYTWSDLRGNYAGLFRPETGQLDPNINSDFDLISLLSNRTGPLPGDRTHQIKVFAAKEFVFTDAFSLNLGVTYRGRSGTPLNALGAHPLYGQGEVFMIERGGAGRLPWRNDIDARLGLNLKLGPSNLVTFGVDVFNVFNLQGITAKDQTYTTASVLPVTGASNVDELDQAGQEGKIVSTNPGVPFDPVVDRNPNFLNVTAYQPPRSVRFGVKVTF